MKIWQPGQIFLAVDITRKESFQKKPTDDKSIDPGVGPGDVVSCLLPDSPQTHYILNPINPLLEVPTIAEIVIKTVRGGSADDLERKVKDVLARCTIQYRLGIE